MLKYVKNLNHQGSSLRLDTIFARCFKREKIAKIAHNFNMALLATHADYSPRKIYYSIANCGSFKNFVVKKERPEGSRYRKYSTHSVNK